MVGRISWSERGNVRWNESGRCPIEQERIRGSIDEISIPRTEIRCPV